jgi:short-subunit dehydrogenase
MAHRILERLLFPPVRLDRRRLRRAVAGKTVLITGASFGIGEALAMLLARSGVGQLVLVARTESKLEQLRAALATEGCQARVHVCDLGRADQVERLISTLASDGGPIDVFVSNAGKSIRRSVYESLDRYHDVTRTAALNYLAPVRLSLAVLPLLEQRGGQIVNSSAANVLLLPAPRWAAYQASKVAFEQWLRSVGPEAEARGVICTNVYLPLVRTRMIEPTAAYRSAPAMSAERAAELLAKAIVTRRRSYRPWWLPAGELASLLFRPVWEAVVWRRVRHG